MNGSEPAANTGRIGSEALSLEKPSVVSSTPCRLCQARGADGCLPDGTPVCTSCASVTTHGDHDCRHETTRRYGHVSNAGEAVVELRCEDCGMSLGQVNAP